MSDVFDRLKNKARPAVPARDTSLPKKENPEKVNEEITKISHSLTTKENEVTEEGITNSFTSSQQQQTDVPQTVRRTIRLDEDIDTKLDTFCNTEKITRDNFIEAAFLACSQKQELMQEILKEAKKRYYQRKQLGEQRKFKTLEKKINS